ncbi:MAG: hypothetical protein ACOCV2_09810, partial [Persicimonas sp.]
MLAIVVDTHGHPVDDADCGRYAAWWTDMAVVVADTQRVRNRPRDRRFAQRLRRETFSQFDAG